MDTDGWKDSKNLLRVFYIEYHVIFKSYKYQIELDKEVSSLVNNIAADETVVGSSVDSGEEALEKVCIDSDSDDEDDELINTNPISSIQQLKAADEEAGKQNSKQ